MGDVSDPKPAQTHTKPFVTMSVPSSLVTPIRMSGTERHWPSPPVVSRGGTKTKENPTVFENPTSRLPVPDEPDEELLPSREVTGDNRKSGDLCVLQEELDI